MKYKNRRLLLVGLLLLGLLGVSGLSLSLGSRVEAAPLGTPGDVLSGTYSHYSGSGSGAGTPLGANDSDDSTYVGFSTAGGEYCDGTCHLYVDTSGGARLVERLRIVQGTVYAPSFGIKGVDPSCNCEVGLGTYSSSGGTQIVNLTITCSCTSYQLTPAERISSGWRIYSFEGFESEATPTPVATGTVVGPSPTPGVSGTANGGPPCGYGSYPPCEVYWRTPGPVYITGTVQVQIQGTVAVEVQNWPTPIPTGTPILGIAAEATIESVTTGRGGAVIGVGAGGGAVSGILESPYGATGPTRFIGLSVYDFGCPLQIPVFQWELCLEYHEITSLNMGPVEIPTWPFTAAFLLTVFYLLRKR